MNEPKFTPGPWECFYKSKYKEWHVSVPEPYCSMRRALFPDGVPTLNPEADARLIAAAPEMYECLQEAITQMCGECPTGKNHRCNQIDGDCFVIKWIEAAKKARGEA